MLILGINAYHGDASACILRDGQLLAAVEEERFNRVKHWAGFPAQSIRYCLEIANAKLSDVDHVALSFNPRANLGRKALFTLRHHPSLQSILDRLNRQSKGLNLRAELARTGDIPERELKATIHHVEHHDAHIASGFLTSPFNSANVLSVDGMGDFVSTVLASCKGTEYTKHREVFFPHSLGFLYNALTLYLGFHNYGDEYKVMGLAPYGKPTYVAEFRKLIQPKGDTFELNLDYFRHHHDGIAMSWDDGSPKVSPFHSELLENLLGPALLPRAEMDDRAKNLAASLQAVTEEIIFHLLNRLHAISPSENIVIVGGCAMNSVAVGKVTRHTPYKNVFVPVGAADNGTCFGAAFDVWCRTQEKPRNFTLKHAYWGPSFDDNAAAAAAAKFPVTATKLSENELLDRVVDAICAGNVVGWFQGRMEFGARALGNRSLVADPRRTDMRDIINLKIKFREIFRPFAPSILAERAGEYFVEAETSPFMERVLTVRPEKRALVPAVTHVDGSGRLQTVTKAENPRYYELIRRFADRTGVPILLNTSLNENEPIVHTPEQAIDCFLRTKMDYIVVGDHLIERKAA